MKSIKKFLILAIAAIMLVATVAFVGCKKDPKDINSGVPENFAGKITVVIDDPATEEADYYFQMDYSADYSKAIDVVNKLIDDDKICMKSTTSTHGSYPTAFGIIDDGEEKYVIEADDAAHVYISFYTNVEVDMGGGTAINYGTEALEYSLMGIDGMSLKDGAVIYLTEGSW